MAAGARYRARPVIPSIIWPGFVDALAGVLLVLVFTVSTFIVVQFFLRDELAGQSRALAGLETQIGALADTLALERGRAGELESELQGAASLLEELRASLGAEQSARAQEAARADQRTAELTAMTDRADALVLRVAELQESVQQAVLQAESAERQRTTLQAQLDTGEAEARRLGTRLGETERARDALRGDVESLRAARETAERLLHGANEMAAADRRRVNLLNRNIAALRSQLAALQAQLDAAEGRDAESRAIIHNLGQRLNAALAQKAGELARFRSEFFGRMREVLGGRSDIRIVGDRFVLGSTVLFEAASAELGPAGRADLMKIALVLHEIAERIPPGLAWLVRVDGHSDQRPLRAGGPYADNWELSQARALSVVRYFVEEEALPANRFAATGFGPHRLIDPGNTPEAHARNRRIELTLTNR